MNRDLRALRILVVVLVPLAVWTITGLIVLWPSSPAPRVQPERSPYSVPGLVVASGEIEAVSSTCDGQPVSAGPPAARVCADARVRLSTGPEKGQVVDVALSNPSSISDAKAGEGVRLLRLPAQDGQPVTYQFSDFQRHFPLLAFALVFVAVVVAVGRWRGVAILLSLAVAGVVVVTFVLPALLAGTNPVAVGLVGAAAIGFVGLYAGYGVTARSSTALVGTLLGLPIIAGLGWLGTAWAHLTVVTGGDSLVLAATAPDLKLTSVMICTMIIAGLGVLIPVSTGQASTVWELADIDPGLSGRRLFANAMGAGRGVVAAAVFPLTFAVIGACLGVLSLAAVYDRPLLESAQSATVAAVVLTVLVGAIGVVLSVPLTTAIAVMVVRAGGRGAGGLVAAFRPKMGKPAITSVAPAETPALKPTASKPAADRRTPRRHPRRHRDDFGDFADLHDPDAPPRPYREEESPPRRHPWR